MTANTRNNSARKKLIPAIAMLTVSAMTLASSTYAWFTMSREVEVNNIKMTASVPEDLQISLGQLTNIKTSGTGNPTADEISVKSNGYVGLQGNQGILLKADSAANADNGNVKAPANDGTAVDNLFWANTADVSEYYRLGKIIPASSINGEDIFFTPDASGNGTTLKAGAKYYQAASLASANFSTLYKWNATTKKFDTSGSGDPARTTLHAVNNVTRASDGWNSGAVEDGTTNTYDSADSWYETNDDGYYVDIPIWIRSSAKDDTTLSVDAYVTTNAAKTNNKPATGDTVDDELYLAARAAIIYTTSGASPTLDSTNLLRIRKDSFASTDSIINYMYSTNNTGDAISAISDDATTGLPTGVTYAAASEYDGTTFLSVPGRDESTTAKYGTMVNAVVRVWLEGEDPNCWNPNAGQDFNISLKFVKDAIGNTTTATENANGVVYPGAWTMGTQNAASGLSVDNGTVVNITSTTKDGVDGTLQFTYDGNKWNQTAGSFEMLDGWTYKITGNSKTSDNLTGATEGTNSIAAWLKTNVTTKAEAAMTYTITETNPNAGD